MNAHSVAILIASISEPAAIVGVVISVFSGRPRVLYTQRADQERAPSRGGLLSAPAALKNDDLDVDTWAVSKERAEYLNRQPFAMFFLGVVGVPFLLSGAFLLANYHQDSPSNGVDGIRIWGGISLLFCVLALAIAVTPYLSLRSAYKDRIRATAAAKVDAAITVATKRRENASSDDLLKLADLWALNRRQLDQYQELTKRQQRQAFRVAQGATIAAFLLLVAGVIIALAGSSTIDKSLGGGLSGLGSLLSSFLAATFFKTAKRADRQLNLYYLEPQRTGRLLAAERLITQVKPSAAVEDVRPISGSATAARPPEAAGDTTELTRSAGSTAALTSPAAAGDAPVPPSDEVAPDQSEVDGRALIAQLVTAVLKWDTLALEKTKNSSNGSEPAQQKTSQPAGSTPS